MQSSIDQPRPRSTTLPPPRKRGPPTALRIETPANDPQIALVLGDSSNSASTLNSASSSDSDSFPFPPSNKPRSLRNMKKLSLTIPSAHSSTSSLALPESQNVVVASPISERRRRPSVASLPASSTTALLHRRDEEVGAGSPSAPYADGPVEILPRIWLGSEDNARDWKGLIERGIRSILNVAKEVCSPFDSASSQPLRPFSSTPNLQNPVKNPLSTYYPAHIPTGRPGMHYLKLPWSHGQSDLVREGFAEAMSFIDQSLERGDGVLIHCQCGVSRSATLAIAVVMRASALSLPSVPSEVHELKGQQAAYAYVKSKSSWIGPNMSLIYQLLDYERLLKGDDPSLSTSERSPTAVEEEEEWGRRRLMMDASSDAESDSRESDAVMQEAEALDRAMEDRVVARKSSASSVASSGHGMGSVWRSRYAPGRKRTGSIASNLSVGSIISEDLVEEDEQEDLLGVGGGFEGRSVGDRSSGQSSGVTEEAQVESLADQEPIAFRNPFTLLTARKPPQFAVRPPPSAPPTQSSFSLPPVPPPPASARKSSFDLPLHSKPKTKTKRRPAPLLPPVPPSPDTPAVVSPVQTRPRTQSRKPPPPPLHLRNSQPKPNSRQQELLPPRHVLTTPSQTLFVFPPSPTLTTRTPSTMTLTSNAFPFPSMSTPRISTMRYQGRTRSFIGLGNFSTPTTACSRVDARGWVGMD
ncbi:hypothetical protein JAAARDRAFT_119951 [Jaapia argillacea MUCL 33604]|uniref:protein-tyrosine-phosphatase n=1 Tax=Jaapia argillacea MUCL 33604 TaxID=933084 RepID=A0A067QA12_9AGAM|nr:hypothetical protein JAAARDRAFT_119951 [Jaapia argillacea MUCL 33604]